MSNFKLKGWEELDITLLNREYDKTVIKKDLLNVAIQLLVDTRYTKEMAAEEILKVIKEVDSLV